MSDTGGGHRAAAEAIRDALYERYGEDQVDAEMIDMFRECRFPLNYMPEFYPWLVNRSKTSWGLGYNLSNTKRRAALLSRTMYMANGSKFKRIFRAKQPDVVVCVHSVIARPTMRAFTALPERPPFITVVTDLVSTHMFWYDRRVERCLVPTQAAYERGLENGLTPEQLRITGLPTNPSFMERLTSKEEARDLLGWQRDKPAILMVAGGDGMGTLYKTARAINDKRLDCQLAIIAGRNKALKAKLDSSEWHQTTHTYPFVTNMPQLMAAADILVTKAGPATITEAAIAGLPMILSDAIPGQEEGNVEYVVTNEAGAYAPDPQLVADTVENWLSRGEEGLRQLSANARRIARPDAVWEIADEVWQWAEHGAIPKPTKRVWYRRSKASKTKKIKTSKQRRERWANPLI